ncbi:hypothetical protein [Bacillus safensis]|uniref:hypothetical protein n=1 Tax=Bacillus safensis TaxID=561879 RepID=UPI000BA5BF7D|nr:hypothetical protein [Bacillus safensis]OYN65454.1 hypothetical protein CFH85_12455 [Bacillus safensis]
MSNDIIIAIIGGAVTIIVGITTAVASYRGTIRGAKIQIQKNEEELEKKRTKEKKERDKRQEEGTKYRVEIIENFIKHEIRENFLLIKNDAFENHYLNTSRSNLLTYFSFPETLKFSEFDKAKYELIKYESEIIREVLAIYDAFKMVTSVRGDIRKLSYDEYQMFKNGYRHCLELFKV